MVTARPVRNAGTNPTKAQPTEAQVMNFVEKGGSVARAPNAEPKAMQHPLKFPSAELFQRLEAARGRGPVKLPRNTWILQAIAEKLERDESK